MRVFDRKYSKAENEKDQRRDTQQRIPERTKNHMEPTKRKSDKPAVAHKMTLKYHVVRVVDVFCHKLR